MNLLATRAETARPRLGLKVFDREIAEKELNSLLQVLFGTLRRQSALSIIEGRTVDQEAMERALDEVLTPQLAKVAGREMEALSSILGVELDWNVINDAAYNWANYYTFPLVKDLSQTQLVVISETLQDYIATPGMTRGQVEERLRTVFGPVRAEMIAVTETTRAYSEATNWTQRNLNSYGIDMERIWRTSNDELVCPICAPLNGKPEREWRNDYGHGPPAHVRCRCGATLSHQGKDMPRGLSKADFLKEPPSEIRDVLLASNDPKAILDALRTLSQEHWGVTSSWSGIVKKGRGGISYKKWDCSIQLSSPWMKNLAVGNERPRVLKIISHEFLHAYGEFGNLPVNYNTGWKRFLEEASTDTLAKAFIEQLSVNNPTRLVRLWGESYYQNAVNSFASLAKGLGRDPVDLALMLKNRYRLSEALAREAPEWFASQLPEQVRQELFKLSATSGKRAFESFETAIKETML